MAVIKLNKVTCGCKHYCDMMQTVVVCDECKAIADNLRYSDGSS